MNRNHGKEGRLRASAKRALDRLELAERVVDGETASRGAPTATAIRVLCQCQSEHQDALDDWNDYCRETFPAEFAAHEENLGRLMDAAFAAMDVYEAWKREAPEGAVLELDGPMMREFCAAMDAFKRASNTPFKPSAEAREPA